jgi:hypothetical protein
LPPARKSAFVRTHRLSMSAPQAAIVAAIPRVDH